MRSAATSAPHFLPFEVPVKPQSSPIWMSASGLRVAGTTGWLGASGLLAGHERRVARRVPIP